MAILAAFSKFRFLVSFFFFFLDKEAKEIHREGQSEESIPPSIQGVYKGSPTA